MANFIDWDDVDTTQKTRSSGGGGGGKFMRLETNTVHRVRPIHKPVMFYKFYHKENGQFRTAVIEDPEKSSMREKHPQLKPNRRFAILVFDRDDENKMKIMEFGATVYEKFKSFKEISEEEPGGNNGADFEIKKCLPQGGAPRDTTYEVKVPKGGRTNFTDEEREAIRTEQEARKEGKGEFDLRVIFKPMTDDEVEEKLFGEGGGSGQSSNESATTKGDDSSEEIKKPAKETSTKGGSDDKDPFNWADD